MQTLVEWFDPGKTDLGKVTLNSKATNIKETY